MRIDENFQFEKLELVGLLKSKNLHLYAKVDELFRFSADLLNSRIPSIFPNYTLHNTGHSFRMIECMAKLVPDTNSLNELEIAMLIQSSLLHDIGMAISEEDITAIKSDQCDLTSVKWNSLLKLHKTEQPPTKVGGFVQGTESP